MTYQFKRLAAALFVAGTLTTSLAIADTQVMVGGAPMMSSLKIPENASKASNLTTLVAAVKAAGLVDTLNGDGPFTVFAPTNSAFEKLPKGTVDTLLKPENKAKLAKVLTYHVVPGKYTAADLKADAMKNGGKVMLKTAEGETLTVEEAKGKWMVIDAAGHSATIETPDVMQANGNVFVIGSVLMPKM